MGSGDIPRWSSRTSVGPFKLREARRAYRTELASPRLTRQTSDITQEISKKSARDGIEKSRPGASLSSTSHFPCTWSGEAALPRTVVVVLVVVLGVCLLSSLLLALRGEKGRTTLKPPFPPPPPRLAVLVVLVLILPPPPPLPPPLLSVLTVVPIALLRFHQGREASRQCLPPPAFSTSSPRTVRHHTTPLPLLPSPSTTATTIVQL